MSPVLVLATVFALPPAEAASPNAPPAAEKTLTFEEVYSAYREALRKSDRRARPDIPEVIPPLVKVYRQLDDLEDISHHDRTRMQSALKVRLEQLRDKLIRQLLRKKELADRRKRRNPRVRTSEIVDEKAAMLAGGGPNARAIQLIDLIQTTIAPESWQRNGGRGSISYFDLLKVLVVRQTGEVHHQLGGALGQLRR